MKKKKILPIILIIFMLTIMFPINNISYAETHKKGDYVFYEDYYGTGPSLWYYYGDDIDEVVTYNYSNPDDSSGEPYFWLSEVNKKLAPEAKVTSENRIGKGNTLEDGVTLEDARKLAKVGSSSAEDPDAPESSKGIIESLIDGAVGILLSPLKIGMLLIGAAIGGILTLFSGGGEGITLSIEDILFNKVDITSIDFFNATSAGTTMESIRLNVATWYVGIRNLSAILLILILIYVAIRMAISTVADDKAKYKTMLTDWLTSLCLLLVLHYIMAITIAANNVLVATIEKALTKSNGTWDEAGMIKNAIFTAYFSDGVGYAAAYLMLETMTLIFLLSYIKRMITIAFLIIIAPLITVTYSVDKIGDGKSQALNTWLKEFIYNILIQPFQCITYISICSVAFGLLDTANLASSILAIMFIVFLWQAEKIIKHIFNFRASSLADTVAQAAVTTAIVRGVGKIGKATANKKGGNTPKIPQDKQNNNEENDNEEGNYNTRGNTNSGRNSNTDNNGGNNGNDGRGNDAHPEGQGNSDNLDKGDGKGRKAINLGKAWLRGNMFLLGTFAGATIGGSTGRLDGAILGASTGGELSRRRAASAKIAHDKHEVARTFNNFKQASGIQDDQEIAKIGMELLNGTRQATTATERNYRDSLIEMQKTFMKNGDDEKASVKHTKEVAYGVAEGTIGESIPRRLYGRIKNGRSRFNQNGYGGNSDDENTSPTPPDPTPPNPTPPAPTPPAPTPPDPTPPNP